VNEAQVIKTEQRLALRSMMAGLRTVYVNYQRLLDRQQLYSTRFLIQTQQQSDAALSSYTNDEGDFTEVVRARIAVLNAELDALNIEVDLRKAKMQMGYYFVQAQSVNSPVAIDSANRPSADASKTPSSLGAN
jgi:outer membrane protein TolC